MALLVDRPGQRRLRQGRGGARRVAQPSSPGQIVTVIGPNGAGKTTLLGAAIGLLPWRGRMSFDGIDLRRLDVEARIERGFCLVPETRELFGDLSVSDNLLLGGYSRRRDSAGLKQSLADVYGRFPRLQRAPRPAGLDPVRRRAPDAGAGPRPDGQAARS